MSEPAPPPETPPLPPVPPPPPEEELELPDEEEELVDEEAPPPPAQPKPSVPYKGRVTFKPVPGAVQVLAVRSGPGTNYPTIAKLPNGAIVAVVKEQGNWGNLQAGGWASLSYIAKL